MFLLLEELHISHKVAQRSHRRQNNWSPNTHMINMNRSNADIMLSGSSHTVFNANWPSKDAPAGADYASIRKHSLLSARLKRLTAQILTQSNTDITLDLATRQALVTEFMSESDSSWTHLSHVSSQELPQGPRTARRHRITTPTAQEPGTLLLLFLSKWTQLETQCLFRDTGETLSLLCRWQRNKCSCFALKPAAFLFSTAERCDYHNPWLT